MTTLRTAAEQALKPCPFCGSEPYSCRHLSYSNWGVTCPCGATGPTKNAGYRPLREAEILAHNEAVAAWNERAALAAEQPQPDEYNRRLRRQLEQEWAELRALRSAEQPQPVARIVSTGPHAEMPLLQWLSADHSFRAPIGTLLYPAPPPSAPEPSEAARLYIDGEWNSYRGELLSLALVGEDGSEWYEVIDFDGTPEPWVAANVMPKLRKAPISLEWMQGSLQRFLDRYPAGVHIVADWPEDIERFCRVLVTGPGQRLDTPPLTMEVVRIDPVSADPHNALADARALRDALRAAAAARTKC